MLRNVEVQAALATLRKEMDWTPSRPSAAMADMARASIEDFFDKDNRFDIGWAGGKLHLLKRDRERVIPTTTRDDGRVCEEVVERAVWLHDAQAAPKTMMEHQGLLSDILEIRRLPKDRAELRQLIKERLPLLFE